jgi:hypothetical protein
MLEVQEGARKPFLILMFLLKICILLLLFFACCFNSIIGEEPHHTTAFISQPGTVDTLLTYSRYDTDHFWSRSGKKFAAYNRFKQSSYLIYSEYAWSRTNSLFVHGGYAIADESMNGTSRAVRDIELGWKHLLKESKRSALTLECILSVPCGHMKSSLRFGKWGAQIGLLYSRIFTLAKFEAWTDVGIGYRAYQGFPSDEMDAFCAVGYRATSSICFIATAQLESSLFNGNARKNLNNIAFHPNRRRVMGKMECLIRLMKKGSLSVGAFQHFWGQNVGAEGGYFCGLWINL